MSKHQVVGDHIVVLNIYTGSAYHFAVLQLLKILKLLLLPVVPVVVSNINSGRVLELCLREAGSEAEII